jgi:hypothetical protein
MNRRLLTPSVHSLGDRIRALAQAFTDGVLAAAKRASLQELVETEEPSRASPPPRATGRPAAASLKTRRRSKRSPEKIASLIDRIVRLVERTPLGLAAGELREHLHLDRSAFMRPIQEAVATGRIAVQGERRLTVYVPAPAKKPKRAEWAGKETGTGARGRRSATSSVASKRSDPHAEAPPASEDENAVADAASEDAETRDALA